MDPITTAIMAVLVWHHACIGMAAGASATSASAMS
jgi:hypothetical protein